MQLHAKPAPENVSLLSLLPSAASRFVEKAASTSSSKRRVAALAELSSVRSTWAVHAGMIGTVQARHQWQPLAEQLVNILPCGENRCWYRQGQYAMAQNGPLKSEE